MKKNTNEGTKEAKTHAEAAPVGTELPAPAVAEMETETGSPEPDIADVGFLGEDLSGVDTSMPLIKEGPCELLIAKLEKTPNKKGTGFNLKFTLKATKDMETTKDDVVHEGFPFFKQISIAPTPDYSEDTIKKAVALFVQCAGGTRLFPLDQYEGKVVPCRVTIKKERTDKNSGETYPPANEIKFVKE